MLHYYSCELVIVWSICSVCTGVTKSKAVILYNADTFAIAIARSRKFSVVILFKPSRLETGRYYRNHLSL